MTEIHRFANALTNRGVGLLSRRASLIGLGGAALTAAVAGPPPARAGKASKKAKKACKRQIDKCKTSATAFCAAFPFLDVEECEAMFLPCCASFKNCKADRVQECWLDAVLQIQL